MLINTVYLMILLCIVVFIYFIFNIKSIVKVFMLSIEKKKNRVDVTVSLEVATV